MNLKHIDNVGNEALALGSPNLEEVWNILGPFQIGTREAAWGADPLESYGGFRNLEVDSEASFPSSLCPTGYAEWSVHKSQEIIQDQATIEHTVILSFPDVDWDTQRSYYGWAAIQYQGWARTHFHIPSSDSQTILLYTDSILEYYVDDIHVFGGDFYSYRRSPLVLNLDPGQHRLDIRFIRDVRAMGGRGAPTISFNVRLGIAKKALLIQDHLTLLPEFVQDYGLASRYGSISVINATSSWIKILSIDSQENDIEVVLTSSTAILIAPSQSTSIAFSLKFKGVNVDHLDLNLYYLPEDQTTPNALAVKAELITRSIEEAHRYTFLHSDSNVSYAVIKVPEALIHGTKSEHKRAPILLNLHGAGLEADSDQVRHMLDDVDGLTSFIVYPTGGPSWSGDDWHTWGWVDVEASLNALQEWTEAISWKGPTPDPNNIYCVGHSNGGQGTWFALTHQPDRFKGAGPVSGYASIQAYVPYILWNEVEPRIWQVVQSSLNSFRHELLMENITHMRPIEQQHGGSDDNVPPYHSRRLHQLLQAAGGQSRYTELAGKRHWFNGIMTTSPLRKLYGEMDNKNNEVRPLSIVRTIYPQSGDMSSRNGIKVDQLISPDKLGSIEITSGQSEYSWVLKTRNIRRFHFDSTWYKGAFPQKLVIDSVSFERASEENGKASYVKDTTWHQQDDVSWKSIRERFGAQLGALDALLRTQGSILVKYSNQNTLYAALEVARNLYQYYCADCRLVSLRSPTDHGRGNVVSLYEGEEVPILEPWFPIQISNSSLHICDREGNNHVYDGEEGLGALFLTPLPNQAVQLNIWGYDKAGLSQANRLIPMMTGTGQPDFIILSRRCAVQGAGGVMACGFLDYRWNISSASYFE